VKSGAAKRLAKGTYWALSGELPARVRERAAARLLRRSGLFDAAFYTREADVADERIDPIIHYLRHGASEGRLAQPLFDPTYYLARYPDVARAGVEPLVHFARSGAMELRDPHPWFDTAFYVSQVPRLAELGINPLVHYLRVGAQTGRNPHPAFDSLDYLARYPEVARAGVNPLLHYVTVGQPQGFQAVAAGASRSPAAPVALATKIAVVVHLYYVELWEEIQGYLANLGTDFDLFVSLCRDTAAETEAKILASHPRARVRIYENRGRDIAPLVELLSDGALARYTVVCKIHSKKSLHRQDGDRWRGALLHQVLGAPEIVQEILDVFEADPRIGLLGPADQLDRKEESWGSNRELVHRLAKRLDVSDDEVRLQFFAGSMFWFRPAALAPLADLGLRIADFEDEQGQLDGSLHHALERLFPLAVRAAGFRSHAFRRPAHEIRAGHRVGDRRVRLIAFYLPQYHPIPENDEWWGPGFTEWTNVATAKPLYEGHAQPRLPKDLGFYDLRVAETREAQAQLAEQYGIHGFCYYYYWFDGRRLLERPLEEVLQSGRPDFPFCVCWANENWTRNWDGFDTHVLVEQVYSLDAARRFIRELIPTFRDPRYIRHEGRPVLLVYRAMAVPDLPEVLAIWRQEAAQNGIELHLAAVRFPDVIDVHSLGFDAAVDFPPHHVSVRRMEDELSDLDPRFQGLVYDYETVVEENLETMGHGYDHPTHRGAMLAWDNTARRGVDAHIAHGATPALYQKWLGGIIDQEMTHNPSPESLVFINAWNEWGEGTTLEPDQHFGHGFLEATQAALEGARERWDEGDEW